MAMPAGLRSILLIEDGAEDFEALTRALTKAGIHNPVYGFSHGESALDFLRGRGRFFKPGSASRPGLVLLDLNLPGADGRHVLTEIKSDPRLKEIPVLVITGSRSPADVAFCYRAGANSFLPKPADLSGVVDLIRRLKEYWFDLAILPDPDADAS
jgi:CheY-like chemotaxis protein